MGRTGSVGAGRAGLEQGMAAATSQLQPASATPPQRQGRALRMGALERRSYSAMLRSLPVVANTSGSAGLKRTAVAGGGGRRGWGQAGGRAVGWGAGERATREARAGDPTQRACRIAVASLRGPQQAAPEVIVSAPQLNVCTGSLRSWSQICVQRRPGDAGRQMDNVKGS